MSTTDNVISFARFAAIAFAPVATVAEAVHPTFTAGEIARMPASEQLYFTDMACAHVAAFEDFRRHEMIEARNRDAFARAARRG